jgi:carbamoyltransferase
LFNPFNKNAKNIVNKVKRREAYRPFGASVLKEDINQYLINPIDNPHMLYVAKVKKPNLYGITHVDNTCRYQTVDQKNKYFYKLLKEFKKITGESIILNTSLNIGGKPIMSNKRDLLWFLNNSDIDYAVYGDEIIN